MPGPVEQVVNLRSDGPVAARPKAGASVAKTRRSPAPTTSYPAPCCAHSARTPGPAPRGQENAPAGPRRGGRRHTAQIYPFGTLLRKPIQVIIETKSIEVPYRAGRREIPAPVVKPLAEEENAA